MADSFFGFDTSINNGDHLLPPEDDDCVENEEEEYDALNDETFGGLGDDTSTLDDWEQQHEQYAENAEHSKHSEELENSVSRLLLDNGDDDYETNRDESSMFSKSSVWAYTPPSKNGESSFDQSLISSLHKASKAFIQSHTDSNRVLDGFRQSSPSLSLHHSPKQICTVEELEKSLLKQQHQQHQQQQQQQQQQQKVMSRMPQFRQMFQHPGLRMPPQLMPMGLSGMPAPPPGVHLTPQLRHPHLPLPRHPLSVPPPGLVHPGPPPPGHFMPPPPALRHPGLIYPPPVTAGGAAGPFPPNHPFNFQQQPRTPGQQQQQPPPAQQQQQQRPPQLTQQILQQIQQRQQQQEFQRRNDNNFQQMQRQQLQQQQHQQQFRRDQQQHGNYQHQHQQHHHHHHQHHENVDEYDGLMQTREKQWLLNIQLLQLNTGTPYFDDYYYTMFKERKAKLLQQQQQQQDRLLAPSILDRRFQNHNNNNNQRNRHNSGGDRNNQDDSGGGKTLTPKIYTPLQFENSLGKLQCGSVTAPRKIIDMDVVGTQDGSGDGNNHQSGNNTVVVAAAVGGSTAVAPTPLPFRDTRRTKQLLLELEVLYGLLLKAEDLRNPMAISNMEKLREIKQKQRLRELELAPTPEQKQEVLRLFKQESEPVVENQHDYIARIVNGLLQEDKFSGYLAIRKGKMLVLRLLPHLFVDNSFAAQLQELWTRTLLGIPFVGRRDTSGDNILPKLLPFFKRFVQNCSIGDVLDVVNALNEVIKQQPDNSRMTPLSHQGRAPLYFVLLNRFGVSALVTLLIRTEYLISSDSTSEKQASEWASFLSAWADLSSTVPSANLAQPLELIPVQIFTKHCNRFPNMTVDKRQILERHLVENV